MFEGLIVSSERNIIKLKRFHALLWEILLSKYFCNLTSPIGAIIKTEHNITLFYCGKCVVIVIRYNDRFDKLIRNTSLIRILDCFYWVRSLFTNSINQKIVGKFYTFPTLITIHSIVTTDNTCNFTCC